MEMCDESAGAQQSSTAASKPQGKILLDALLQAAAGREASAQPLGSTSTASDPLTNEIEGLLQKLEGSSVAATAAAESSSAPARQRIQAASGRPGVLPDPMSQPVAADEQITSSSAAGAQTASPDLWRGAFESLENRIVQNMSAAAHAALPMQQPAAPAEPAPEVSIVMVMNTWLSCD